MKKCFYLCLSALVLTIAGLSSCSDEAGQCGFYNFQYSDTQGLKYIPSEIK